MVVLARAESNLLENSPFLPPDTIAHTTQQSAPLELRSIVKEDGQYEFSLYDSAKKQSTWVRLNEPGSEFRVKTFDPANNAVTVEQHNRTYTLALKEAKITALGMRPGSVDPSGTDAPSQLAQPFNRNAESRRLYSQHNPQRSTVSTATEQPVPPGN
jgi:hypothetical protein